MEIKLPPNLDGKILAAIYDQQARTQAGTEGKHEGEFWDSCPTCLARWAPRSAKT